MSEYQKWLDNIDNELWYRVKCSLKFCQSCGSMPSNEELKEIFSYEYSASYTIQVYYI